MPPIGVHCRILQKYNASCSPGGQLMLGDVDDNARRGAGPGNGAGAGYIGKEGHIAKLAQKASQMAPLQALGSAVVLTAAGHIANVSVGTAAGVAMCVAGCHQLEQIAYHKDDFATQCLLGVTGTIAIGGGIWLASFSIAAGGSASTSALDRLVDGFTAWLGARTN